MPRLLSAAIPLCLAISVAASGQVLQPSAAATAPGFADLADMVLAAPVIVDATIRSTARIKGNEAAGVVPGHQRQYIEADVGALIRGAGGTPARVGYLLDLAPYAAGRFAKLKKTRVIALARPVPQVPGQLQLVAPDAQLPWTADTDARVRAIAKAAVAADAPPPVNGIGNAFHVPGALPGEGETQVFVATADNTPMSLSILRRPGERPRWAVALSEVVDEAAGPPPRDTLLWYRLACGLPAALPDRATATLGADDAAQARTDYAFVLAQLGPCGRTRG
ncbi:hypothetical protein [Sphingomonas sp.]|uniref:hypothetical protein n=1 Tax=Sphingomonas sp. TaxID=28214 RepID=UPI0035BBDFB6